jgi:Zn-dependent M28 family amino/carboxypeptidase
VRRCNAFPVLAIASAAILGCAEAGGPEAYSEETILPALESITAADILSKTTTMAADEFEGRAPGTPGEDRTVEYLTAEFQRLGLQPGNPDGTWVQAAPLVGFTATVTAGLTVNGKAMEFVGPRDFVAETRRVTPEVRVDDSEVVFVGYGVVAPEYGWDDYKGMDVAGKTLLMLVNDPQIPSAADPAVLDDAMFKGRAMTYYGRWTYKYEIATEKGAAAVLVIHETGPAGYPWDVPLGNWGREGFDIKTADGNMSRVPVQGWIRDEMTKQIFAAAGQDFDQLKQAALSKDFQPVTLPARASFLIRNSLRDVASRNVIAKLEGSGPVLKDEYVVYTAHWDHLGKDPALQGDQIFNGALDNASGTAALLELAEAFTLLDPAPPRSILFLAVTAEEKGLLGAKYYALNPLYPLAKTLANINMDGVNQWGRTEDITVIGLGNSTLDDILAEAVATQNRTIEPDPESEKGFFYRSDHFEFA